MKKVLLVIGFLLCATFAQAQVVVSNQSGVQFIASTDHNTTVGGVAVVDHYDLTVVAQSPTSALGFTFGLGKPTPDATNTITVKPISSFGSLATGQYSAFVAAVGPGGAANSPSTSPFVRVGAPAAPGKPTVVPQ